LIFTQTRSTNSARTRSSNHLWPLLGRPQEFAVSRLTGHYPCRVFRTAAVSCRLCQGGRYASRLTCSTWRVDSILRTFHFVICLSGTSSGRGRPIPVPRPNVFDSSCAFRNWRRSREETPKIRNDHFRLLFRYQMAARKGVPLKRRLRLRPPGGQNVPQFSHGPLRSPERE
jgi:hypothetical protein